MSYVDTSSRGWAGLGWVCGDYLIEDFMKLCMVLYNILSYVLMSFQGWAGSVGLVD
jgi:hypothetical protein